MRYLQHLKYIDITARVGSIRRAAETLAITSTALNRRILAIEEDLGTPIFERLHSGVKLSAAGELYIHHVRQQLSDMERVRSRIADLSGQRRGHVAVICGQALMAHFIPMMVSRYRSLHPGITFSIFVTGREKSAEKLADFSADIAIVFEPEASSNVQVLESIPQQLHALVACDHPLANKTLLRLSDCADYPMALPSLRAGIRNQLESAIATRNINWTVAVESDNADLLLSCLQVEHMIAFQLPIAFLDTQDEPDFVAIPVDTRDLPAGNIKLLQQKGRILPVAAEKFSAFVSEGMRSTIHSVLSSTAQ